MNDLPSCKIQSKARKRVRHSTPSLSQMETEYIAMMHARMSWIDGSRVSCCFVHFFVLSSDLSLFSVLALLFAFGFSGLVFPCCHSVVVPSILSILTTKIFSPFNVFQAYSVIVWSCEDYYFYAAAIFFVAMVSILDSLYQTRTHYHHIATMAHYQCWSAFVCLVRFLCNSVFFVLFSYLYMFSSFRKFYFHFLLLLLLLFFWLIAFSV